MLCLSTATSATITTTTTTRMNGGIGVATYKFTLERTKRRRHIRFFLCTYVVCMSLCLYIYILLVPHAMMNIHDSFANRSNFSCIKQQLRSACTFIFECLQKRNNNNEACVVVVVSLCLLLFILLCLKCKRKINEINMFMCKCKFTKEFNNPSSIWAYAICLYTVHSTQSDFFYLRAIFPLTLCHLLITSYVLSVITRFLSRWVYDLFLSIDRWQFIE